MSSFLLIDKHKISNDIFGKNCRCKIYITSLKAATTAKSLISAGLDIVKIKFCISFFMIKDTFCQNTDKFHKRGGGVLHPPHPLPPSLGTPLRDNNENESGKRLQAVKRKIKWFK